MDTIDKLSNDTLEELRLRLQEGNDDNLFSITFSYNIEFSIGDISGRHRVATLYFTRYGMSIYDTEKPRVNPYLKPLHEKYSNIYGVLESYMGGQQYYCGEYELSYKLDGIVTTSKFNKKQDISDGCITHRSYELGVIAWITNITKIVLGHYEILKKDKKHD